MNGEKLEVNKYFGATLSKDRTSVAENKNKSNKNCYGDRSDGHTEQVVDKQFHQLHQQAQALQVPRSLHLTPRLRHLDLPRGHKTKDTVKRVRPEHNCNTCWSTRAPTGDRQTIKAGFD
ncbi:hypothetical protein DPMN_066078 [Dreissena polymorpha]|uniref:Uncharacterized protein n=1 Tax=Dreissena polymorpha TaxID=45954 RepID=A0A9D3YX50_DREPO|nr:hypothetical protein DPMN_066078 [Dreissena polymorpha]